MDKSEMDAEDFQAEYNERKQQDLLDVMHRIRVAESGKEHGAVTFDLNDPTFQGATSNERQQQLRWLKGIYFVPERLMPPDEENRLKYYEYYGSVDPPAYSSRQVFRHSYSSIVSAIQEASASEQDVNFDGIDYIAQHLRVSLANLRREAATSEEFRQLVRPLDKLQDHISLEITTMSTVRTLRDEALSAFHQISGEAETLGTRLEGTTESVNVMERSIKNAERDYIGILGVFSAIVLAFNASVTFTTTGIREAAGAYPFQVAFMVVIVALFLFNALALLYRFVWNLMRPMPIQEDGQNQDTSKRTGRGSDDTDEEPVPPTPDILGKRFVLANVVLLLLAVVLGTVVFFTTNSSPESTPQDEAAVASATDSEAAEGDAHE